MKRIFLTTLFFFFLLLIKHNNILFAKTIKPFPEDTLQVFIKNYGKDSLLKLIDERIALTQKAFSLFKENKHLNSDLQTEYVLIQKHFLNINDTLFFDDVFSNYVSSFMLYDTIYGLPDNMLNNILDTLRKSGNASKLLIDNIGDGTLLLSASFCSVLSESDINKFLDTIIRFNKDNLIEKKLLLFRSIANIDNKCHSSIVEKYEHDYYEELYKKCSYPAYFKNILKYEKLISEGKMKMYVEEEFSNYLRFVTYATYANQINLKSHSNDLMQVLFLQTMPFGYWQSDYTKKEDGLLSSTIYGYWTLLQFRELLIK